jgi:N-acetylglucosaminyldiphosphoundecaprenol N-acetyl-beta-D-mannosaminyltransferase
MFDSINILGIRIHPISRTNLNQVIAQTVRANQRALILNVNAHAMNLAYENSWLRSFFNQAEIMFSDGMGVIMVAKLLGYKIPERITYADWMWELASIANDNGYTMFFLGAKPTVAEKAALKLRERFPMLNIVGSHHGYFDKDTNSQENTELLELINLLHPNVLILGLGMPIQERWLSENWAHLNVNIALTGGAVFDYVSGELDRAPRWMTDNGLEWFGRLLIEPRRLWKRYILGNPLFLWRVFMHHILGVPLPNTSQEKMK